jgi:hypothetical protein
MKAIGERIPVRSEAAPILSKDREILKEVSVLEITEIAPKEEIFKDVKNVVLFNRNSVGLRPITANQLKTQYRTQKRNKSASPVREAAKSKKNHGKIVYNPICEIDPNATPEG